VGFFRIGIWYNPAGRIQFGNKRMSTARHYQTNYTYEDYCQWQGDWELWYGTAVSMTPSPFEPHESFVSEALVSFGQQIKNQECDCKVYAGLDWIAASHTVVRPDLMVVCGERVARHLDRPPQLIIEVISKSTETRDRRDKHELYESQGVKYYILADTSARCVECFVLEDERYRPIDSPVPEFVLDESCKLHFDSQAFFD
jgi:Uma2 family endonuclease